MSKGQCFGISGDLHWSKFFTVRFALTPTKYTRGTTSYTDRTIRTLTKQKEKKKKKPPKQYAVAVGRCVTVTVSVDKIEGLNGREYEVQGALVRTFISPASAATGSRAY